MIIIIIVILEISDKILPKYSNPPFEAPESNNSVFWSKDHLQENNSKNIIKNSWRLSSSFSA